MIPPKQVVDVYERKIDHSTTVVATGQAVNAAIQHESIQEPCYF